MFGISRLLSRVERRCVQRLPSASSVVRARPFSSLRSFPARSTPTITTTTAPSKSISPQPQPQRRGLAAVVVEANHKPGSSYSESSNVFPPPPKPNARKSRQWLKYGLAALALGTAAVTIKVLSDDALRLRVKRSGTFWLNAMPMYIDYRWTEFMVSDKSQEEKDAAFDQLHIVRICTHTHHHTARCSHTECMCVVC